MLSRLISVAIVIVGVTGLTWLAVNALRPDLRAGDHRFILVAWVGFLQRAFLHFNFGVSTTGSNRDVRDLILEGLPADLGLLAGGLTIGLVAGIAGGAVCAARPSTFLARALDTVAVLFMCAPALRPHRGRRRARRGLEPRDRCRARLAGLARAGAGLEPLPSSPR